MSRQRRTSCRSNETARAVVALVLASAWAAACDATGDTAPQCGDAVFTESGTADAVADAPRSDGGVDATVEGAAGATQDAAPDATTPADAAAEARSEATTPESGPDASLFTEIRVANWSPDTPAIDFCIAVGNGAFRGPILGKAFPDAGGLPDGGAIGLAFPQVSAYTQVAAGGALAARIVSAGAPDCSTPLFADSALTGDAGSVLSPVLFALTGTFANGRLHAFPDEVNPAASTNVAVRFIHAAPGVGALDFGTIASSGFSPLFTGVAFSQASLPSTAPMLADGGSGPRADSNGYLQRAPFAMAALGAQLSNSPPDAANPTLVGTSSFSAAAGAVVTFAVVGSLNTPSLVRCFDNAASALTMPTDLYGACAVVGP